MRPISVVAAGAVSALGTGEAAYRVGALGERAVTAITRDPELEQLGFRHPFRASAPQAALGMQPEDRARALLELAARQVALALDQRLPGWRRCRIGVVVGTSSGGMLSLVECLRRRARGAPIEPALAARAPYFAPLAALDALGVRPVEQSQVLAACASSAVALGLGCRWLELGLVDLVVAGGYDAVGELVAAGFEVLGATSATRPAPFRLGRDGMALGEGAALLALARGREAPALLGSITGFGASSDARHATAPDRSGAGLAAAARAALRDAGLGAEAVDWVSAHGTATPFNDASEARALALVLGERATRVPVHPFKAVIGHTLGAGSALELLAALDCMARGIVPAACGEGDLDPEARVALPERHTAGSLTCCLKLSAAFGGANAALLVRGPNPATSSRAVEDSVAVEASVALGPNTDVQGAVLVGRPVRLLALGPPCQSFVASEVAALLRLEPERLSRLDPQSALAVAAAAGALAGLSHPLSAEAATVVGTSTATLENDEAFDRRLRERGPRGAEPRRFPATSPNLVAGQVSIALGLRGPSLAVGAGAAAALEALCVAHDLVAAGDAPAALVVIADDVGPVVRHLWAAAGWDLPAHGSLALVLAAADAPAHEPATPPAPTAPSHLGMGDAELDHVTPLLDRRVLGRLHADAAACGWLAAAKPAWLSGEAPGWPSALAALRALGVSGQS